MRHLFRAGCLLLAGAFVTYGLATFMQMNAERQVRNTAFEAPTAMSGGFFEPVTPKVNRATSASVSSAGRSRQVGL